MRSKYISQIKTDFLTLESNNIEGDIGDFNSAFSISSKDMLSSSRSMNSNNVLAPLCDFQRSIDNEKNLRKYMNGIENVISPSHIRNDRIINVIEKNYKLQIQTLLEELNQSKLDKRLLEKKFDCSYRFKGYTQNTSVKDVANENMKLTLDAKDSIIQELEYQIYQIKSDNNTLKITNEMHEREIQRLNKELTDKENLKCIIEENNEEIVQLKEQITIDEGKYTKIIQELEYYKNENKALRIKSQNNSFYTIDKSNNQQKEQSFLSTSEIGKHQRILSEVVPYLGISQISEINDGSNNITPKSAARKRISKRNASHSSKPQKYDFEDREDQDFGENLKIERPIPIKALKDYENKIKTGNHELNGGENKMLEKLIEIKKIKNHYILNDNKRLLDVLEKMKRRKNDNQNLADITNSVF